MRYEFANPPLEEVVVAVYFPPIKSLQTQHAGYFWSLIRKQYPSCESITPVGEALQFEDEPVPLPRYKFTSDDDTSVVQIQKNGFMINWRMRNPEISYPHYETIKSTFIEKFSYFKEFISKELGENIQEIDAVNLGYMNFIVSKEEDVYTDACTVLRGLRGLGADLGIGPIEGFSQTYVIDFGENRSVRVSSSSAQRNSDEAEGTRFEIRAVGIPNNADTGPLAEWLDESHNILESLFINLTSEEAHKRWGAVQLGEASHG